MHSISQWAVNWVRGLMVATALVLSQQTMLIAKVEPAGIAIISSRNGDVRIDSQKPKLHTQVELTGKTLQTGTDSSLFIVLSNGVAISLGSNTELTVEHYTQTPFSRKKQSQQYEPSKSHLKLKLTKGSLCCAFGHLSPLSEARVETPNGELRIHKGNSMLRVDAAQTEIHAFSGSATFYYPHQKGRTFIANSQSVVIDSGSATTGKPASTQHIEQLDQIWHQIAEATDYARTRIFFQGSDRTAAANPILVLPDDFHSSPSARPYHFKERVRP